MVVGFETCNENLACPNVLKGMGREDVGIARGVETQADGHRVVQRLFTRLGRLINYYHSVPYSFRVIVQIVNPCREDMILK